MEWQTWGEEKWEQYPTDFSKWNTVAAWTRAIEIFGRHSIGMKEPSIEVNAVHDRLYIGPRYKGGWGIDPLDDITDEEAIELSTLGFHWDTEVDSWYRNT